MKILGIIPARYASFRLPGKPLARIGGKPMIQRVYEQALQSKLLSDLIIATDDQRILEEAARFNAPVLLTSNRHENGTERCAEVISHYRGYDYVINIQGDEPFIHPDQIDLLAKMLDGQVQLGTVVKQIEDPATLDNPAVVKVIFNRNHEALYFSRTCIPYVRDLDKADWMKKHVFHKHICIYGYRTDILQAISRLPQGSLEQAESLEQLRWLEAGYSIRVAVTEHESFSVDTPDDLRRANKLVHI